MTPTLKPLNPKSPREIDHAATGARARKLRKSRKITLTLAAARMDISPAYLCQLENGIRRWTKPLIADFTAAVAENPRKSR